MIASRWIKWQLILLQQQLPLLVAIINKIVTETIQVRNTKAVQDILLGKKRKRKKKQNHREINQLGVATQSTKNNNNNIHNQVRLIALNRRFHWKLLIALISNRNKLMRQYKKEIVQ